MRTKNKPVKRQPRTKQTAKKKKPTNNLSKTSYRSPKKTSNNKTPSTPSTSSTVGSTLSSKSAKSNATTKTIDSGFKKVKVEHDFRDTNEDEDEDEDEAEAFDVYETDWTSKSSLASACNFLLKKEERKKLVGASHRMLVKAVLDSQNLSVCKQLYQIVAQKVGNKRLKETLKETQNFGNKSKPIIVDKIMSHVNRFNKEKTLLKRFEEEDSNSDSGKMHSGRNVNMDRANETDEDRIDFDMSDMDKGHGDLEDTEEEFDDGEEEEDNEMNVEDQDEDMDTNEDEDEDEDEDDDEEEDGEEEDEEIEFDNVAKCAKKKGKPKNPKPAALKTPEDDEDSVDPFDAAVFSAANIKKTGVTSQQGSMNLHVSKPIKVIGENKCLWTCVFELGLHTFFFKGEHLALPLTKLQESRQLFKNHIDYKMTWVQTIQNSDRRIAHSVQDAIMKTNKNNTQSVIHFVVEIDSDAESSLVKEIIESIVADYRKCFKIYSKPGSVGRGTTFLDYLQGIGNQGLYGYFLRRYSDGVHPEPAADALTAIFDAAFNEPGLKVFWNISLDKFLTNFEIKQILVNKAHASGWDDLTDHDKEACFLNGSTDMSRLPNWNSMVKAVEYSI